MRTTNGQYLEGHQLASRLRDLLRISSSIDVAMAWIRCGDALDAIEEFASAHPNRVRVIAGINAFITEPEALRRLHEVAQLKIAYGTSGIKFHSKMVVFNTTEATKVWVGSANLTDSAFLSNRELVYESDDLVGEGSHIFAKYWSEFNFANREWLARYALLSAEFEPVPVAPLSVLGPPESQPVQIPVWNEYVTTLRTANHRRLDWLISKLGEVNAIACSDWQLLTKVDAEKLLGIADGYGGLGRLKGAGQVKNIFYESSTRNLRVRQSIADALDAIPIPLAPSFEPMLERAFNNITAIDRVSVATVTRLMAVRRPNLFVSVNGMSISGLSALSGVSQNNLLTARGYIALIRWVMQQPWWTADEPHDDTVDIWKYRAALLDIIAYAGDNSKGMEGAASYVGNDE